MVWLFEGYPDRPERLRRWFLEDRISRRVERRIVRRSEGLPDNLLCKLSQRAGRRARRRRVFADLVTEPGITITAELAGGVLVALQVDRLTDPTRPGSLTAATLGVVLITLGVFAARSRAAYDAKLRDGTEDRADRRIVEDVANAVQATSQEVAEQLVAEIDQLREAVDARTEELRAEVHRVRHELDERR